MKNITFAVEEETLKKARRLAAERETTVNAIVRDYLRSIVQNHARKANAAQELKRFFAKLDSSKTKTGPVKWNREAIYESRVRR